MKLGTQKQIVCLLVSIIMLMIVNSASVQATQTIQVSDYAPGLFYQFYDYKGEGNEYAPFTMTLDYLPDEAGVYQVSRATTGTTVSYVYQLTDEGIYELAYYPESYDQVDLRYEEDSTDDFKSLFFPATLNVGDHFKRGYRSDQTYQFIDFIEVYEIDSIDYYNVVVIETILDDNNIQRYYYAPQIGEIYSEFIMDNESNGQITSALEQLKGPTYQ